MPDLDPFASRHALRAEVDLHDALEDRQSVCCRQIWAVDRSYWAAGTRPVLRAMEAVLWSWGTVEGIALPNRQLLAIRRQLCSFLLEPLVGVLDGRLGVLVVHQSLYEVMGLPSRSLVILSFLVLSWPRHPAGWRKTWLRPASPSSFWRMMLLTYYCLQAMFALEIVNFLYKLEGSQGF